MSRVQEFGLSEPSGDRTAYNGRLAGVKRPVDYARIQLDTEPDAG